MTWVHHLAQLTVALIRLTSPLIPASDSAPSTTWLTTSLNAMPGGRPTYRVPSSAGKADTSGTCSK